MEACAYGSVYVRDFIVEDEEVVEKQVVSYKHDVGGRQGVGSSSSGKEPGSMARQKGSWSSGKDKRSIGSKDSSGLHLGSCSTKSRRQEDVVKLMSSIESSTILKEEGGLLGSFNVENLPLLALGQEEHLDGGDSPPLIQPLAIVPWEKIKY